MNHTLDCDSPRLSGRKTVYGTIPWDGSFYRLFLKSNSTFAGKQLKWGEVGDEAERHYDDVDE